MEIDTIQELGQNYNFTLREILPFTTINKSTYEKGIVNQFAADKACRDQTVLQVIKGIKKKHPNYGYRSITNELKKRGHLVNHKRVLRLMNENNLTCKRKSVSL